LNLYHFKCEHGLFVIFNIIIFLIFLLTQIFQKVELKMSDERVTIEDKKDDEFNQGCFGSVLGVISTIVIIVTLPLSIWFCIKIIQEYERAAIFRLGRLKSSKAVGPGLFWINMFTDSFIKVFIFFYILEYRLRALRG
jgi:hypothetical protein